MAAVFAAPAGRLSPATGGDLCGGFDAYWHLGDHRLVWSALAFAGLASGLARDAGTKRLGAGTICHPSGLSRSLVSPLMGQAQCRLLSDSGIAREQLIKLCEQYH